MTLARYILENDIYQSLNGYKIWYWMLSGVSLIIILLYSASTYRFIHKPLALLVKAFRSIEKGDLEVNINHNHNDEFRYIYQRFNIMVDNLNLLIDQVYKQKILAQHAELKQLQSQINPHFLYNTFFVLLSIAKSGDNESVIYFLQRLGSYFQFITRNTVDEVPLHKEVEHAQIYTDIQVMRFSNRIHAEFDNLPEEYRNITVPRLIIQPIIENAFLHGLEDKINNGMISVSFLKCKNSLQIIIEDNGENLSNDDLENMGKTLSEEYSGEITAIVNIHRRLRLKNGSESGLAFFRGELGGLKTVISIVLQEAENV
jgi:two-component system, sensor histidine kinase YesM